MNSAAPLGRTNLLMRMINLKSICYVTVSYYNQFGSFNHLLGELNTCIITSQLHLKNVRHGSRMGKLSSFIYGF